MSEEIKIISFEELDSLVPDTKIVKLPGLSERAGRDVNVKIRPIAPMDLLELYNVPMDEVNAAIAKSENPGDQIGGILEEQISTFDIKEINKMMNDVVEKGLVEPTPAADLVLRLGANDLQVLFTDIMELTNPKSVTEGAARFPDDGELGGD